MIKFDRTKSSPAIIFARRQAPLARSTAARGNIGVSSMKLDNTAVDGKIR